MFKSNVGLVIAVTVLLAGCSGVRQTLGLERSSPDEFRVLAQPPLTVPPDFNLRPPMPGGERPTASAAEDRARTATFGRNRQTIDTEGRSPGEVALLTAAGADRADPEVRDAIEWETPGEPLSHPGVTDAVLSAPEQAAPSPGRQEAVRDEETDEQDDAGGGWFDWLF